MIEAVPVNDSQTVILQPPQNAAYQFIALSNNGGATVYLRLSPGPGSELSTDNGIALPPGAALLIDQDTSPILQNGIWGVTQPSQNTLVAVQAY